MISSGWRKKRKVIEDQNVLIVVGDYLEPIDRDPLNGLIIASTMKRDLSDMKNFHRQIKISEVTNYNFYDCNIYIQGSKNRIENFQATDAIRNCVFFNCTIFTFYEENVQFRYCMMTGVKFDIYMQRLDFSCCGLTSVSIGDEKRLDNLIFEELSFNKLFDARAKLFINKLTINGQVHWIWIHNANMINIDKFIINSSYCTDIACLDEEFIYKALKDKKIDIVNDDYTVHDYSEEREEPSYFPRISFSDV